MSKTRGCNLNSCADLVADLAAVIEQVMPLAVPRAPAVSRPPPRRESRGSRYIAQAGAAVSLCFYPCIQCFRLRFFLGAVTPLSALEMRNYPQVCLIASSMLLLLGVPVTAQPAPASSTPSTQPGTAPEQPFSNADVVKLTKLDLGNEVVIAKISQATAVDFKLDTDSLVALKQEGVSKEVIAAMLNRTSAPQIHRGTEAGSPPGNGSAPSPVFGGMTSAGDEGVILRGAQGEIRLQSVQGDISSTYIFVATLMFLDFPGLKADVKISDRRPTFVVRGSKSPRGRVFLVKCESNEKDNDRSVKVGRAKLFSQKSWATPDKDWMVEFDIKEFPNNTWEITPKADLKPGEYGVLFRGGFLGMLGGTQAELFDFSVG